MPLSCVWCVVLSCVWCVDLSCNEPCLMRCYFVKCLKDGFTKNTHDSQHEMTRCDALLSRAEHGIPELFRSCPHCGHETPFYDQNEASKIGDSVLCSRVWCFVFCKIFARWVYKKHAWLAAWDEMTRCDIRCSLVFDALYFVKYLQDGFTKTHAWD